MANVNDPGVLTIVGTGEPGTNHTFTLTDPDAITPTNSNGTIDITSSTAVTGRIWKACTRSFDEDEDPSDPDAQCPNAGNGEDGGAHNNANNMYQPTDAQLGKHLRVLVSYTDGVYPNTGPQSGYQSATILIADASVGNISLSTAAANVGTELSTPTTLTVGGIARNIDSRQWQRCTDANCATTGNNTVTGISTDTSYTIATADINNYIRVLVGSTDGGVSDIPSNTVTVDKTATIAITGTVAEGSLLTASVPNDPNGNTGTVSYQWEQSDDGSTDWENADGTSTERTYQISDSQSPSG